MSSRDARLFRWLCEFLRRTYDGSRRAYAMVAPEPDSLIARVASVESDGELGLALLTEIQHQLGSAGGDVLRRREFYKEMLLRAVWAAKLPCLVSPRGGWRGWHYVRLKPRRVEPPAMRLMRRTLAAGRLPEGAAEHVLSFGSWYGHRKLATLPTPDGRTTATSIDCSQEQPALRLLLRRALNFPAFPRCEMTFAHAQPIAAEWCGEGRRVWLVAASLWPLIEVLRQLRDLRGGGAELLHVKGYGAVLI